MKPKFFFIEKNIKTLNTKLLTIENLLNEIATNALSKKIPIKIYIFKITKLITKKEIDLQNKLHKSKNIYEKAVNELFF